ncbi:MAG: YedE-related selenium metabolism membrane protein [Lachnospiraceae bacterium]|jgi:YedE family putative selenium metabolism protein|nr:YedE-related selenium metabolism membrane protein [Lachnospiraceae bacterium]
MSFSSKKALALGGVICGLVAVLLAYFGNPANMAICVACFIRDSAGALKMQQVPALQYFRPEIVGIVVGAFFISICTKEYKSMSGSSPMIRFILGFIMMVGALVFLGCPLRMVLRMSAGDLNAYIGLIGFALGIATGVFALRKGFSLGRAYETHKASGAIMPLLLALLMILAVTTTLFAASKEGVGSMHAPIIVSLLGGLAFGIMAQRTRMCFAGGIRDVILIKNFDLLMPVAALFVVMLIYNIVSGNFNFSFTAPIAHSQHIWNILGMYAVGFAAVLAGGCPLRQLILTGTGSSDAAVTVLGMFVGGAICQNFGLASSGTTPQAVGGTTPAGRVACIGAIVVCFIIAFVDKRDKGVIKK